MSLRDGARPSRGQPGGRADRRLAFGTADGLKAGLADHTWTWRDWFTRSAAQSAWNTTG